jgi:serine/threonine-protein phosphatase 2A regulatory subunit A
MVSSMKIIRLANNEQNFTYRVSATLLMCNVYPRAGPNKEKIRQYSCK